LGKRVLGTSSVTDWRSADRKLQEIEAEDYERSGAVATVGVETAAGERQLGNCG
jgi:hypothetical protein